MTLTDLGRVASVLAKTSYYADATVIPTTREEAIRAGLEPLAYVEGWWVKIVHRDEEYPLNNEYDRTKIYVELVTT